MVNRVLKLLPQLSLENTFMVQQQPQSKTADHRADDGAEKKRVKLVGKFEWSYWSDHSAAIISLFVAAILFSPIFEFMGENVKVYSVAAAIWIVAGTLIFFMAHSVVVRKEGRSTAQQEAQDEKHKTDLQAKIAHLESSVAEIKTHIGDTAQWITEQRSRALTDQQRKEIVAALLPFAGQKISVQCQMFDVDGLQYAQQFVSILLEAKWNAGQIMQSTDSIGLRNAGVGISKSDADGKRIPAGAVALSNVLARLGITAEANAMFVESVPVGEIRLFVGVKVPGKPGAGPATSQPATAPATQSLGSFRI